MRRKDSRMETEWNGTTTSDNPIDTSIGRTTKPTMEKDVVEAIETAAPTINEGNEDVIVPVDIVVEKEGFKDRDGVEQNDDQ